MFIYIIPAIILGFGSREMLKIFSNRVSFLTDKINFFLLKDERLDTIQKEIQNFSVGEKGGKYRTLQGLLDTVDISYVKLDEWNNDAYAQKYLAEKIGRTQPKQSICTSIFTSMKQFFCCKKKRYQLWQVYTTEPQKGKIYDVEPQEEKKMVKILRETVRKNAKIDVNQSNDLLTLPLLPPF